MRCGLRRGGDQQVGQPLRGDGAVGKRLNDKLDLSWEVVHSANQRDSSGTALADTAVHNLRATWAPDVGVLRGATVRVGVENLFDLDYVGHLSSPTRKAPGRTLNVTLTKTF